MGLKIQHLLLLILCFGFTLQSCKKDSNTDNNKIPDSELKITLSTLDVSNITETSAQTGLKIVVNGSALVLEAGVCWSELELPTINENKLSGVSNIQFSNDSNSYDLNIENLNKNTTYHLRAYARLNDSTYYGDEITFKTSGTTTSPNQFWAFSNTFSTNSLFINYDPNYHTLTFLNEEGGSSLGAIEFSDTLQAPNTYSVVNPLDSLQSNQAKILAMVDSVSWSGYTNSGSSITTKNVDGKTVVEFQNLKMRMLYDSTKIVNTSAYIVID